MERALKNIISRQTDRNFYIAINYILSPTLELNCPLIKYFAVLSFEYIKRKEAICLLACLSY